MITKGLGAKARRETKLGSAVQANTMIPPELLDRALDVFGAHHKAIDWLQSPIAGIGGKMPSELAISPAGLRKVLNELGRIEYGVF